MESMAKRSPTGLVTLQDIADRCGVQVNAVSRALRGMKHVSPALRARVQEVAAELGYNPAQHDAARRLALRRTGQTVRTHVIALFLPLPESSPPSRYFSDIYYGILRELETTGYSAQNSAIHDAPQHAITLPIPFHRGDVDGVIMMAKPYVCYPLQAALRALPTFGARPVLSLMHQVDGTHFVGADDRAGACAAASHLLTLGHRRLLLFVDRGQSPIETARIAGVCEAYSRYGLDPAQYLHQYRLPCDYSWLNPAPQFFTTPEGTVPAREVQERQRLADYLHAHPEITGLLAQNDTNARHAWYTLRAMGRRVPDDISLIGFDDDNPIHNEEGHNILTSVRLPLFEIGRTAARTLIRHIEEPELPNEESILPPALILRASTGPAPR